MRRSPIIEYASMTCPHCAQFPAKTFPELKERYIDTGKVRFIFREFPLDPLAAGAFMLARCADKDKYFAMVDMLFGTQRDWVVPNPLQPLLNVAKQAGYTEETVQYLSEESADARRHPERARPRSQKCSNVKSTPTFFVNGKRVIGDVSIEEFEKEIEALSQGVDKGFSPCRAAAARGHRSRTPANSITGKPGRHVPTCRLSERFIVPRRCGIPDSPRGLSRAADSVGGASRLSGRGGSMAAPKESAFS